MYGFTPKLSELASAVASDIGDASFWASKVDEALFELCKERYLRGIKSCKWSQAMYLFAFDDQ